MRCFFFTEALGHGVLASWELQRDFGDEAVMIRESLGLPTETLTTVSIFRYCNRSLEIQGDSRQSSPEGIA